MSGLCGWLDGRAAGVEPSGLLDRMAAGLAAAPDAARKGRAEAGRGLALAGPESALSLAADGAVWAAIQGEPRWSDPALAEIAGAEGHARALAAAYERFGTGLFEHLHGPWSLAVIDGARRRALVAIDRLAIHALCFAPTPGGGMAFGTATDCLRAHPAIEAAIRPQAVFDYLYFTRSPAPGTIYRGIEKLIPGQYALLADGRVETGFYWRLAYDDDASADAAALAAELKELLRQAVARASDGAEADEIGAYLSGGVDSSTVTGFLAERFDGAVSAFGIGFDSDEHDEMAYARITARHFGVRLHEYAVTPRDIVEAVPLIAAAYDEPFGNSSAVAAYYCARVAREHGVGRLLAGDGGDELFAGNARYAGQRIFEAYGHIPAFLRRFVIEPVVFGFPGGQAILPVRKARSYIRRASIPLPDRLESYNYYNTVAIEDCFEPDFAAAIDRAGPLEILRMHYHGADARSSLNRMMHLDIRTVLADDDLRKVRRTAELAGVEVRFPLLDEDVVAFSGRVPAALKLKGMRLRYFFKWALADFLARETLTKKKHGFGLPFGHWLKTDPALQEIAYDSLSALKRRGFLRPAFLDSVVETHREGHSSYHGELVWVLMMLELWLASRDAPPAAGSVAP